MTEVQQQDERTAAFTPNMVKDVHVAWCGECGVSVTYRPLASGNGFEVLGIERAPRDTTFGVGPNGRPECPHGDGEMMDADDRLPADQAIRQVAEMTGEPEQMTLPGARAPFNYEGAYLQLAGLAVDADAAHKRWEAAAEHAKDLKKVWERLAEKYQLAGLELERWRKDKGAAPAPDVERCRFEQLHPGIPCPISHEGIDADVLASESHGIDANHVLVRKEAEETIELLKAIPHVGFTVDNLIAMDLETRSILEAWVRDYVDHPDRRDELMTELPRPIDTAHKAGPYNTADPSTPEQLCRECGAVLFTVTENEPALFEGTFVGTGCEGKAKETGNRYPKRGGKKARRRQPTDE